VSWIVSSISVAQPILSQATVRWRRRRPLSIAERLRYNSDMKKIGMFLFALALVAAALVDPPAEAAACVKPVCSSSLACCNATECVTWCRSIGGGDAVCVKLGTTGGCCACRPLEG
jgi:hypothetical protein